VTTGKVLKTLAAEWPLTGHCASVVNGVAPWSVAGN